MAESMADTLHTRVMCRAADAVGGVGELAKRLGFSHIMVRAWMTGTSKPPEDVFFKAVAILHGEESGASGSDASSEAKPPRDARSRD